MPALRIAEELKAATGCTMLAAQAAAAMALSYCANVTAIKPGTLTEIQEGYLVIRCCTDSSFLETWSDHVQGRERCDELNRELDHPAYFIA
jgi:hypothetical protein